MMTALAFKRTDVLDSPAYRDLADTGTIDAIFGDMPGVVALLDTDLSVIACNQYCIEYLQHAEADVETCSLSDAYPKELADERVPLATAVFRDGQPRSITGMCQGVWRRASFRRITTPSGHHAVLATCISISEFSELASDHDTSARATHDDLGPLAVLTEREAEILRLIGLGLSTNDIAHELHRSAKTVQGHRNALGHKLGIENRVELARIAIRAGLTLHSPDEVRRIWRRARSHRLHQDPHDDE